MRYLNIVLSILAALTVFVSCDFLEETPRTEIALGEIVDEETLEYALTGVYSRLQGCYASNVVTIGELGTDISCTANAGANLLPIDTYAITSSTAPCENYWKSHFLLVRDANIVIDKANTLYAEGAIEKTVCDRVTAEARALRGFAYSRLMMTYGELPVIDRRIDVIGHDEFSFSRESIDSVFHFIESDYRSAIDSGMLKNKDGGRMNIWAAKGLLAKLYLYVGTSKLRNEVGTPYGGFRSDNGAPVDGGKKDIIPGYSEVREDCETLFTEAKTLLSDIITNGGFSLTANYQDPFIPALENNNSESIWEVQFISQSGYGSDWSKLFGISTGNNMQNFSSVGGRAFIKPCPGFYKYFRLGDLRRDVNYAHNRIVYFEDQTIQNLSDSFTFGVDFEITNPATGRSLLNTFSGNLNADIPELLEKAYYVGAVTSQAGSWKYGWGEGSDPSAWINQTMSYTINDCPNNVVVLRYADILLMYAEVDMLLNGADPAHPDEAHASQEAVDYVNQVLDRAVGYAGYDDIKAEFLATFNEELAAAKTSYDSAKAAYDGNPNNDSFFKTYYNADLAYKDAQYKVDNIDELCAKPYTTATLTYEALIDERAKELWGEFHRWYDLQRLGWIEYKVLQRCLNFQQYPLPAIDVPKHYLYPLPLIDIDLSVNEDFKKNNPGY